ncbi:C6 transcription factor [Fusarium phyllophilum]|uniref:C6 transcription factor n=1 Tax=Fusarium phyllophilum TaxID=47803 RepID=A0A8H5MXM8_9HYPO|nr:C6 transcription factor [Fusarium phyllophilum]
MCNPDFNDISLQHRARVLKAFRNSLDQDNSLTSEMRLGIAMSNEEMLQKAYEIANGLAEWKCKTGITSDEPLALLSETYRGAAFIYLESVLRKRFSQHIVADVVPGGISTHIEAISTLSDRIPQGAFAECSLLFPPFVAGICPISISTINGSGPYTGPAMDSPSGPITLEPPVKRSVDPAPLTYASSNSGGTDSLSKPQRNMDLLVFGVQSLSDERMEVFPTNSRPDSSRAGIVSSETLRITIRPDEPLSVRRSEMRFAPAFAAVAISSIAVWTPYSRSKIWGHRWTT